MMAPASSVNDDSVTDAIVLTFGGLAAQYGSFWAFERGYLLLAAISFIGMAIAITALFVAYVRRKGLIWKQEVRVGES